jgi:glutaredoxin
MIRALALAMILGLLSACTKDIDMVDLREQIGDDPVIMLSTSTCGYCKKLRADLADWNVEFRAIDVESNRLGQIAYDRLEGRGVPIVLVGDRTVPCYCPERARALLTAADLIPTPSNL